MKTVLIAVYSHPDPPYIDDFYASRDTWDSVNVDGVETVYYFPKEWTKNLPRTIAVEMDGGFWTAGKRDLLAFKWMLDNKSWDYMARVNCSCYVRKKRLLEHVQTLPANGVFQGIPAPRSDGKGKFIYGGCHFILSRDVVDSIVKNGEFWDHTLMEDEAISALVEKIGIPWNTEGNACSINHREDGSWVLVCYTKGLGGSFEMKHRSDVSQVMNHYFIRVKQDGHRKLDRLIMQELHQQGI